MNSTRALAIVAVLTAATLVIGVTFAATPSAFAKGDGNTVTIQKNKQKGSQSGFDNDFEQEATNLICTHPDATCLSTD
jgi:hypothetical protein